MRSTQLTIGSLAVITASALIGAAAPASSATAESAQQGTTTQNERGIVIECTGKVRGKKVWTSLYENNVHVNVIQVVIGDHGTGGSREVAKGFLDDGVVRGSVKVAGKKALITGTAHRVGKKKPIHEEHDDAGQHITVDGFHRRLANDLELTYAGRTVPLACDHAFFYNLTVTKEDITD